MFFTKKPRCCLYKSILLILVFLCTSTQLQSNEGLENPTYKSTILANYLNSPNGSSSTNCQPVLSIPPNDLYILHVTMMTVDSIGMLCNLLLILVIIIDPLKILHRGAWMTILNLSIADFTACIVNFVLSLLNQINDLEILQRAGTPISFFWMFASSASFMLLTLLTAQMYIIIKYPIRSKLALTGKNIVLACMTIWVLAVGLGLTDITYMWSNSYLYFYIGNIAVLELAVAIQVVLKILTVVEIFSNRESIRNAKNRKQNDVAKTVMMLNVILIVTAFPYFLAKQIEYIERLKCSDSESLLINFPYYYQPICLLNFVVNPVLYSLRMQDYCRSLIALLKLDCKRRHHRSNGDSERIMMTIRSALE